jgi:hypothetical protein
MLTPLPPARTGVAHYASMLLPALARRADVTAFDSLRDYRREDFDVAVYQLGNNPFHAFAFEEAMRHPGVTVLHDFVLRGISPRWKRIMVQRVLRGRADVRRGCTARWGTFSSRLRSTSQTAPEP